MEECRVVGKKNATNCRASAKRKNIARRLQEKHYGLGNNKDEKRVLKIVKWFSGRTEYGFINRNDSYYNIFFYQSSIVPYKSDKIKRCIGYGETVKFNVVVGEKEGEPTTVTGSDGEPMQGFYAADRRHFRNHSVARGA